MQPGDVVLVDNADREHGGERGVVVEDFGGHAVVMLLSTRTAIIENDNLTVLTPIRQEA